METLVVQFFILLRVSKIAILLIYTTHQIIKNSYHFDFRNPLLKQQNFIDVYHNFYAYYRLFIEEFLSA